MFPRSEDEPSLIVTIPYLLPFKRLKEMLEDKDIKEILSKALSERIKIGGLKLSHIFEASFCNDEALLKQVEEIEPKILALEGKQSLLDLILAIEKPGNRVINVLKSSFTVLYKIIEQRCEASVEGAELLLNDLAKFLRGD